MSEEQQRRRAKKWAPGAGGADHIGGQTDDPHSARLLKMSRSVGNDTMSSRLERGNGNRDELLAFISHRLRMMREVQVRESSKVPTWEGRNKWWRAVGDIQKEDVTKPKPTRWIESAALYEKAIQQLCRGNLHRGASVFEQALEAEKRAFDDLTSLIDVSDIDEINVATSAPGSLDDIVPNQACGVCDVPEEIEIARRLQLVTEVAQNAMNRKRKGDPYWTLEEEEEEEDDAAE